MPKIAYQRIKFGEARLKVIQQANRIIADYTAQGFDLTLRQLYYQFVSRDLIPNSQREYKKLGDAINDARLAGLIDWDAITDRTRNLRALGHWNDPADIINSARASFHIDKWATQPRRVEVWIEKDALVGVIQGVCNELDVPYFSCRGFTSQSEMWEAGQRMNRYFKAKQRPLVIHLGDHDPSGIDMSRDIEDRLILFTMGEFGGDTFDRIALNRPQVDEFNPPPNPAKATDSRYVSYQREYGDECWELDALDPGTIVKLIRERVEDVRDNDAWEEAEEKERHMTELLKLASENWEDVAKYLKQKGE